MLIFCNLTFMVPLFFLLLNAVSKTSSADACNSALGLEDGRIKDNQLSASSHYSRMYIFSGSIYLDTLARFGRLKNKYAWCADHLNLAPYFQIDFREMVVVTALATQGFRANWKNNYVKTYTLKYSVNGSAWYNYSSPNRRWTGNKDGNTVKKNTLKPFQTRYLRIYPQTYSSRKCLRVEVYGCRLSEMATTQSPTEIIVPTNLVPSVAKVVATATVSMSKTMVTTTTLPTSAELVAEATTVTTAISSSITATVNPDGQATTQSPAEVIAPTTLVPSVAKVVDTPTVSMSKTMVTTTTLPTSAELVAKTTTVTTAISSSITATVNPDGQDTKNVVSSHTLLPSVSTMPIEKSDTKTKAFPPSEIMKVTPSLSSTQNVSTPTKEIKAVATSASEANVMLLLGICVGCGMLVVVVVLVFMLLRNKIVRGTEMRHRSLELQSSLDGKEVTERFIKQEYV